MIENKNKDQDINWSPETLLSMGTEELLNLLVNQFYKPVPLSINSPEEAAECGELLAVYANNYAYLMALLSHAKAKHRIMKREKAPGLDDMTDKRDMINNLASAIKLQYQSLSRLYTIRKDTLDELKMTEFK